MPLDPLRWNAFYTQVLPNYISYIGRLTFLNSLGGPVLTHAHYYLLEKTGL